jgi:hypothetical protein
MFESCRPSHGVEDHSEQISLLMRRAEDPLVMGRQCDQFFSATANKWIGGHDKRADAPLDEGRL